ncbi:MAG: helix-turn-helix domain-containing protein [Alphaproteobacteria bacterium]|nr:helix-turn-helix domain-containing protein [Alphaproteobacteria bacterium]
MKLGQIAEHIEPAHLAPDGTRTALLRKDEMTGPVDPCRPDAGVLGNRNTVATVAAYLGCSIRTVQRRIEAGDLQCTRHGRVVRLSQQQVEAFEAKHSVPLRPNGAPTFHTTSSTETGRELALLFALRTEQRRKFGKQD